jgi:hypothetical protein
LTSEQRESEKRDLVGDLWWHVHHEILCEMLTEPIQGRIDYIKSDKPKKEVETRLKWLTPVAHPEKLPAEWKEAYQKREEAYQKQKEAYQKQKEAYQEWETQLEALHKEEHPGCPWNGTTIFPKERPHV